MNWTVEILHHDNDFLYQTRNLQNQRYEMFNLKVVVFEELVKGFF